MKNWIKQKNGSKERPEVVNIQNSESRPCAGEVFQEYRPKCSTRLRDLSLRQHLYDHQSKGQH